MDYSFLMNNSPVIKELGSVEEPRKIEENPEVLLYNVLEVDVVHLDPVTPSKLLSSANNDVDDVHIMSSKEVSEETTTSFTTENEAQDRKCSCPDCETPATSPSNVKKQGNNAGNNFQCKICKVTFSQPSLLELHKKQHEARPYVCGVCKDTFAEQHALKVHQKRHLHTTVYKCEECNATFTTPSRIQMHKEIHLQTRPFSCEICGAAFLKKSGLSRHLRAKPMVQDMDKHIPDLLCESCGLTFISNCGKRTHREVIHFGDERNSKRKCLPQSTSQENQSPREVVNVYYIDLGGVINGTVSDKKIIKAEDANSDIAGVLKELPSCLRDTEDSTNVRHIKEEIQQFIPPSLASVEDAKYRDNSMNYEVSGGGPKYMFNKRMCS